MSKCVRKILPSGGGLHQNRVCANGIEQAREYKVPSWGAPDKDRTSRFKPNYRECVYKDTMFSPMAKPNPLGLPCGTPPKTGEALVECHTVQTTLCHLAVTG